MLGSGFRSTTRFVRCISLALVVFGVASCSRTSAPAQPNVLLISIDTLRRDALGCYGANAAISPFLDRFAADCVVFDTAISQAPWTLPSHAAMFTSLYPTQLDLGTFARPTRIHNAAVTLAEVLKDAKYQTFAIVAGGFLVRELGFAQGFDSFDPRGKNMPIVVDKFLEQLDARDPKRPFFAFLHTYDVHKYNPSDEDRKDIVTIQKSRLSDLPPQSVAELLQSNDKLELVKSFGPNDRLHARQIYDAAVHSVDREFARLLRELDQRGIAGETIVIVTSDHGEEFWEHDRAGHGYNLNDENLRVPLLVRHPSHDAKRVTAQVRLIDLAPTIVNWAGAAPDSSWQGQDLEPLLDGAELTLPAFSESAHLPMKSVRSIDRKLIVSLRRPFRRVFDLRSDPQELQDHFRADDLVTQRMTDALSRWIVSTAGDTTYHGAGEATLDPATAAQLKALGYTSAGETVPAGAAPWLEALAGEAKPSAGVPGGGK